MARWRAKKKTAGVDADGLFEIWLPVVDAYRTQLAVPSEEILTVLAAMQNAVSCRSGVGVLHLTAFSF